MKNKTNNNEAYRWNFLSEKMIFGRPYHGMLLRWLDAARPVEVRQAADMGNPWNNSGSTAGRKKTLKRHQA